MATKKKAAPKKPSKFEASLIATEALKPCVAKDMLALFNHSIELAKHSHRVGYPKRAGIELAHARKLATARYGGKI
jgi:hypothetical protein